MDDFVELVEEVLGDSGWSVYDPHMAPEFLLEAPDGCVIELDGTCPHGERSPLLRWGLI